MGYQVVFTMNSAGDAEELSKMIGKFTRKKVSRSQGNLDLIKSSDSTSSEGYELVPAQDILNMPNTDILILVRGFVKHPIKAKVNYWFKNPQWKGADKIPLKSEEELAKEKAQAEAESQEQEAQTPTKVSYVQVVNENPLKENAPQEQEKRNAYMQVVMDENELKAQKKAQEIRESRKRQEEVKAKLAQTQETKEGKKSNLLNKEEKQAIIEESQMESQEEQAQAEESGEPTTQEKIAYIKQELGSEGYKKFLLHLAIPDELDETPTEEKVANMRALMEENRMPMVAIKQIVAEIKNKEEEP